MPIMTEVGVRISMIRVNGRYYSFNYIIKVNGKLNCKGSYESDHEWDTAESFKEHLKDGAAVTIALEQIKTIKL